MFPTELEITMQRRQFEREAANYRLAQQFREDANQPTLVQRISRRINLGTGAPHASQRQQVPCPEAGVKARAV